MKKGRDGRGKGAKGCEKGGIGGKEGRKGGMREGRREKGRKISPPPPAVISKSRRPRCN